MADEEVKKEEVKQEEPVTDILTKAQEAYKKLDEKHNQVIGDIKKLEELEARRLLSGTTKTGIQPIDVKPESPQEYARRISGKK